MTAWLGLLLPLALIFARTTAFVFALPLFSSRSVPAPLKAGLGVMLTVFFARFLPAPELAGAGTPVLLAIVLLAREIACGLALGLAARLVFNAVQQGGILIGRQMGFAMASIIDPSTGEQTQPFGMYLDVVFTLLFFIAGGHHLLLRLIRRSFEVLPLAGEMDFGALAAGVLAAGSAMLMFALKLAGPVLAGFLILAVVLGVLARVLPEMDILLTSLPLRVAVGLILATVMVPFLQGFTDEVAGWLNRFL
ncbi:MAG TPA: flagellar biosynthetic protein FliR [Phycisphaerae bacterium]|nr:flagellar biosynthetic protein FliR [Phycisphaerae bacterium]